MTVWNQLNEFDRWACIRRLPTALRTEMEARGPALMLAGGYIRSCVTGEPINDIDLFVTVGGGAQVVAESLAKEAGASTPSKTPNSWTLTLGGYHVQIIHRWAFDKPEDCAESFDFTIAKSAIWHEGDSIPCGAWRSIVHPQFYPDLAAKRLVYTSPVRNEDAGGSLLRVLKFYQRGYRIPLDSLGAVIARLNTGIKLDQLDGSRFAGSEEGMAKVITGLLRTVDPLIDPFAGAHIDTPGTL